MPPTHHLEIERKFDVPCDADVPDLQHLPGVGLAGPTSTFHLAADYWDTRRLHLARQQITLRRRTGGTDAGWHLKVGAGVDGRAEHACELGDATHPPEALVALVRHVVGEHPLHVVARVDTRRHETPLLSGSGAVLARFCDDVVVSDTPAVTPRGHRVAPTDEPGARPGPADPPTPLPPTPCAGASGRSSSPTEAAACWRPPLRPWSRVVPGTPRSRPSWPTPSSTASRPHPRPHPDAGPRRVDATRRPPRSCVGDCVPSWMPSSRRRKASAPATPRRSTTCASPPGACEPPCAPSRPCSRRG